MCQLLGMNSHLPASLTLSFTGFSQRGGCTDEHADGWGIAFFEYMVQVPANRIGSQYFSPVELKTIQEVVSLIVFTLFSYFYLRQPLSWNHLAGFALIALGAALIFRR